MLKQLFFALFVRPLILIVSGTNVSGRENLPVEGPCIIAANHNSHLDTLVLMSLFPLSRIERVRPVAAADYFMKNRAIEWFSKNIIGIIPLKRKPVKAVGHPLSAIFDALERGEIVILFPEGSRGEAEKIGEFKTGLAHIAKAFPNVPVVPVYIHGAGKALPKGEALFVPFVIDVYIEKPLYFEDESVKSFTARLEKIVKEMERKHGKR